MRSQSDQIIDYLAAGHTLTPIDALKRFGCFRLGARVYDLKREGHRIKSEMVRKGEKRFARYSLG